eukprot:GFYU01002003.1.p1 GENE.GFYU01002003.1~~GFYU01002003.1.p1  ORF type:complete len:212 (-),score=63.41 GFYU01002003.1:818-1453(-)
MTKKNIAVTIVSDVVCPWCWVGKRKLEQAMKASADQYNFTIEWLPYQLRPETPVEGKAKAPNTPDNPRVGARLKQGGLSVGIDFTGKTDRVPNTNKAHIALSTVHQLEETGVAPVGAQNNLAEVLFRKYFTDGHFLDNTAILAAVKEVGVKPELVKEKLDDEGEAELIRQADTYFKRQGVSGVPTFIFNGKPAFSGAQPTEAFLDAFDRSA